MTKSTDKARDNEKLYLVSCITKITCMSLVYYLTSGFMGLTNCLFKKSWESWYQNLRFS